jgi:hypothetical protein
MRHNIVLHRYRRAAFCVGFILVIAFINYTSIQSVGGESYYWLEAENTTQLYNDLVLIEDAEASGNKALVSDAESHNVNSYAVYDVNVGGDGIYQLWARLWASNACGNSCLVSIDQSNSFLVGNTDLMQAWHWVKGPAFQLTKGHHKLFLWNEEWGTRIDRFLLTTDQLYLPSKMGEGNDFEINFNADIPAFVVFDQGNPWQRRELAGDYKIYLPENKGKDDYFIFKKPLYGAGYFKSDFIINKEKPFSLTIIYNYLNRLNYRMIELTEREIISQVYEKGSLTSKSVFPRDMVKLLPDSLNQVSLIKEDSLLSVKVNGIKVFTLKTDQQSSDGIIGLGTRRGNIYFDNIIFKSGLEPLMENNFFDGMSGNWRIHRGEWSVIRHPYYNVAGKQSAGKPAFITTGEEFWKNYSVSTTFRATDGSVGLAFNLQNAGNYYMFRWQNERENGVLQLLKVCDDREEVLASRVGTFDANNFYKMKASYSKGYITASINEESIFSYADTTFAEGGIGLWATTGDNSVFFDDISVKPFAEKSDTASATFIYEFFNRLDISEDLSDWDSVANILSTDRLFADKEPFQERSVFNKKIFTGAIQAKIWSGDTPSDVDFVVYLRNEPGDLVHEFIFKHDRLIFKVNGVNKLSKEIESRESSIKISYKDSTQQLTVHMGDRLVLNTTTTKLGKYRFGMGFKGIGRWTIQPGYTEITADQYYVRQKEFMQ